MIRKLFPLGGLVFVLCVAAQLDSAQTIEKRVVFQKGKNSATYTHKLPSRYADYDAYVQDPRAVTEKLLAFLGLDWHEGCLEFQKNATRVRTASVAQVREPIYRKSSGRWKNYERQLAALAPALGAH